MPQMVQVSQTAPVPPQTLDVEESVPGAMLPSPGATGAVSELPRPDAAAGSVDARGRGLQPL